MTGQQVAIIIGGLVVGIPLALLALIWGIALAVWLLSILILVLPYLLLVVGVIALFTSPLFGLLLIGVAVILFSLS